ncbi:MAG: hypothetical protein OHK0015_30520 [Chloroflexi bacterium OHK40]
MVRDTLLPLADPVPASFKLFAGLLVLAVGYLLAIGEGAGVALLLAYAAYTGLLTWLSARLTVPVPDRPGVAPVAAWPIGLQLAVIIAVLLCTGLPALAPPFWTAPVERVAALGDQLLPAAWVGDGGNALANPLQYFVVPLVALLLLGARPAELGLGRGWRVGRVCLVWLALPVVIWLALLAFGALSLQTLIRRLLGNALQNGFFEEFLLRGALQTRLERLLAPADALVFQALAFGLWHIVANTRMMDGDLLAGLAVCVASQAVSGLCLGLVFRRTGNLVAPSVAHVAMNALGQSFG